MMMLMMLMMVRDDGAWDSFTLHTVKSWDVGIWFQTNSLRRLDAGMLTTSVILDPCS